MLDNVLSRVHKRDMPNATPALRRGQALPRTQTQVQVIAARDNCLVLRDGSVVAAVGVGSVDDALLSEPELALKLQTFRDFLANLKFDIQLLIGTRPQNLDAHYRRLNQHIERLELAAQRLADFHTGLEAFVTDVDGGGDPLGSPLPVVFADHFGWQPADLVGIPGGAHNAAQKLCQPDTLRRLQAADSALRQKMLDVMAGGIAHSIRFAEHWQAVLYDRLAHVEASVQAAQAPVRTFYVITSHNPRLLRKAVAAGPLSEEEFIASKAELDERCRRLQHGIELMRLPAWRAAHDDLLLELRHFYHPSQAAMARRRSLH